MALPKARPAIKLERIKAADQMEFPKAKPLSRSQRVWKRSALHPERKRTAETIATRTGKSFRCRRQGLQMQNANRSRPWRTAADQHPGSRRRLATDSFNYCSASFFDGADWTSQGELILHDAFISVLGKEEGALGYSQTSLVLKAYQRGFGRKF